MTKPSLIAVFSLALSLAACGGGGGGGSTLPSGGSTSTPAPVGSPTPATGPGTPLIGTTTMSGGWTPYGVASGLDFPVQHGWDGTGQSVGIVIDSDVDRLVIKNYFAQFGMLSPNITTISVDGSSGIPSAGANPGDQTEAYLDVETVGGLAPGAHIYIYQIYDLQDSSIAKAYSKLDSDGLVKVANSSFGGCENTPSQGAPPEDPFIASGAQAGIAYVASGGDNGNVCNPPSQVGANWPASNPNVIGVGGTETRISTGNAITSSTVWNDDSCSGSTMQCAGGGGPSQFYNLPSYQSGLSGAFSTKHRNTPDVSMPAEDTLINDGSPGLINGTSWSAPEYAALMAELYQYCHATAGIANPVNIPYYVAAHAPGAYIDVTKGNDQFGTATPFYTAAAGYDDASGFGVPMGMAWANTACPGGNQATGLLARSALSSASSDETTVASRVLDVTPRVAGLIDQGRRSQIAVTPVLVVLQSEADRSAVETALEQQGFTIDRRYTYRGLVDASAPAAAVERTFSTQLHDVLQAHVGVRSMAATQIMLPDSLASHVRTVSIGNVVTRHVLTHRALDWPLDLN